MRCVQGSNRLGCGLVTSQLRWLPCGSRVTLSVAWVNHGTGVPSCSRKRDSPAPCGIYCQGGGICSEYFVRKDTAMVTIYSVTSWGFAPEAECCQLNTNDLGVAIRCAQKCAATCASAYHNVVDRRVGRIVYSINKIED